MWVGTEGGGIARWVRGRDRFVRYGTRQGLASDNRRAPCWWTAGAWSGSARATPASTCSIPRTGAVRHFRHRRDDAGQPQRRQRLRDRRGPCGGALDRAPTAGWTAWTPQRKQLPSASAATPKRPTAWATTACARSFQDAEGKLWIGTEGGGLSVLDSLGTAAAMAARCAGDRQSLSHDRVRAMLEDDAGRLWVGTRQGLNLLEREDGRFQRYANDPADPAQPRRRRGLSLYQDQGGVLWVGTRTAGVHRWNPRTWSFGHHRVGRGRPGRPGQTT